ncbi:hypothetical protein [Burkholderia territorii]|nr:hypothetical protein [Burkholderia territorii]
MTPFDSRICNASVIVVGDDVGDIDGDADMTGTNADGASGQE